MLDKSFILICQQAKLKKSRWIKILPENTNIFSGPVSREEVPSDKIINILYSEC